MGALGQFLHSARMQRKVTLRQMAEETGFSAMYISEIENGKKIPISGTVLPMLAAFFDVDLKILHKLAFEDKNKIVPTASENNDRLAVARAIRSVTPEVLEELKKILERSKESE